jgi:hypothetical protein
VLQRLTDQLDAGQVIARGLYATTPSLSVADNRFGPYWSSQHFVIRALHQLHTSGAAQGTSASRQPYYGRRAIYRRPSNAEFTKWLAAEATRRSLVYLGRSARRLVRSPPSAPHWRIALRRTNCPMYAEPNPESLQTFQWIPKPPGRFQADPFLIDHAGSTWVFFEDCDDRVIKGSVACARISDSGSLEEQRTVLERPYHLSYPHVFEHAGEMFMVPESQQSGTVDLFRARRFPNEWVREATLLELRAVDSTVFEHDGCWWMLSSPRVVPGHAALTYLWQAPALTGPWKLASHSPMNADVRNARGAGRAFINGSELWRPSQDCSIHYGRALKFNCIRRLGGDPLEEVVRVVRATGTRGLVGIHTYNRSLHWEAIDGYFIDT